MFESNEEKIIINMFENKNIDMNYLEDLLDNVDLEKYDSEDWFKFTLLSECIYHSHNEELNIDLLDIVKLFVKKGFNLDLFGNTLIGYLHFAVTPTDNMIRVAKYILDNKSYIGDIDAIFDGIDIDGMDAIGEDGYVYDKSKELANFVIDYISKVKPLDEEKWNPSIIDDPEALINKLKEYNIINKKIISIRALGRCYNLYTDYIEEAAYSILKKEGNSNYEELSNFSNIPLDLEFYQYIEVDEPIIIKFDDGNQLELEFSYPSCKVKSSINKINKFDTFNINAPNVDLNFLFFNCIGKRIKEIMVQTTSNKEEFEFPPAEDKELYIKNIVFKLEDDITILFSTFIDYGTVTIEHNNEDSKITFKNLKEALIHNIYDVYNLKKYEQDKMDENKEQIELNIKLYNECWKQPLDRKRIADLIKQGANPLGTTNVKWPDDHLYGELMPENDNLYEVTKVFLENGMIIKNSMFKNDGNDINPLWNLAFCCNRDGIETLKLLLDNNLDVESVEQFIEHVYIDYLFLDLPDTDDAETNLKYFEYAMKMLMLCASYKYVFEKSEYLRNVIEVEKNNYDVNKFREYDNYSVRFEKKFLYFTEKQNNKNVWKINYDYNN